MQSQARVMTSTRSSLVAVRLGARPACAVPFRRASTIRCTARPDSEDKPQTMPQRMALPLVVAIAGAMLAGAAMPDDAMAARSGGRMGGSSFRSARPAPSRGAPARSGATYNTYVAPPVYGGYGYGYGGGMPFFVAPIFGFGFGGFLQFILGMVVVSTVFNVIRSIASPGDRKRDRDEWDD